jgi:hypothetical protein
MGNLVESAVWEDGVPYFEDGAVLTGGPDCPDNIPLQALANRTAWLKQQSEANQSGLAGHIAAADPHPQYLTEAEGNAAIAAAVAALVNSSPTALDTLKELADALGDDANFAATVTGQLALKAPLASPAFTGTPTAPEPAANDNSAKVSTTGWIWNNIQSLVSNCISAVATSAGFTYSLTANGYIKFPTWLAGIVLQWCLSGTVSAGASGSANFPIAFPNVCLWAFASPQGSGANGNAGNVVAGATSKTNVALYNWGVISAPALVFAIGT